MAWFCARMLCNGCYIFTTQQLGHVCVHCSKFRCSVDDCLIKAGKYRVLTLSSMSCYDTLTTEPTVVTNSIVSAKEFSGVLQFLRLESLRLLAYTTYIFLSYVLKGHTAVAAPLHLLYLHVPTNWVISFYGSYMCSFPLLCIQKWNLPLNIFWEVWSMKKPKDEWSNSTIKYPRAANFVRVCAWRLDYFRFHFPSGYSEYCAMHKRWHKSKVLIKDFFLIILLKKLLTGSHIDLNMILKRSEFYEGTML